MSPLATVRRTIRTILARRSTVGSKTPSRYTASASLFRSPFATVAPSMPPPRTHITSPCPHHHHCRTLPPAPSPVSSSGHHYHRRWHCGGLPVHRRCARGFAFIMYDALVPADHRQPAPAPNPLIQAPSHPMLLFGQASSTRSAASTASRPNPPWRAPRRSRPPTEHSPQNALCLSATGVPVRSAETKAVP